MLKLLLIGVISCLFISCKTSFRISVQEPATINLPYEAASFGIINAINQIHFREKAFLK